MGSVKGRTEKQRHCPSPVQPHVNAARKTVIGVDYHLAAVALELGYRLLQAQGGLAGIYVHVQRTEWMVSKGVRAEGRDSVR